MYISKSDENLCIRMPMWPAARNRANTSDKYVSVGQRLPCRPLRRVKASETTTTLSLRLSEQLQELQRNAIAGLIVSKSQGVVRYSGTSSAFLIDPTPFKQECDFPVLSERDNSGLQSDNPAKVDHVTLQNIPNTTGLVASVESHTATPRRSFLASTNTGQSNLEILGSGSLVASGLNSSYSAQSAYTNVERNSDTDSKLDSVYLEMDIFSEEDDHVCDDDPGGCDCRLDLEDALVTLMAESCSLPES